VRGAFGRGSKGSSGVLQAAGHARGCDGSCSTSSLPANLANGRLNYVASNSAAGNSKTNPKLEDE
jgi:hypothetical protein